MTFTLRDGVVHCIANKRVVLLDTIKDQYQCLPPTLDQVFARLCDGEPLSESDARTLRPLIASGQLVPANRRPLSVSVPHPIESLIETPLERIHPLLVARALLSRLDAEVRQSKTPLHIRLTRFSENKAALPSCSGSNEQLSAIAKSYWLTRRLKSAHDRCLPWSLGLATRLVHAGMSVQFVIGVKMNPFGAHAWVQHDQAVLSDYLDEVLPYTPILAI